MKFDKYDFNLTPYDNLKTQILSNNISKTRFGNKFKKLYKRHNVGLDYNFIAGAWGISHNVNSSNDIIEKLNIFRDRFVKMCSVYNPQADVMPTKNKSYVMVWATDTTITNELATNTIDNYELVISSGESVSGTDSRYKAKRLTYDSDNSNPNLTVNIEPSDTIDTELTLSKAIDATVMSSEWYNKYMSDGATGLSPTIELEFETIRAELKTHINDMLEESILHNNNLWDTNKHGCLVISVAQIIEYIDRLIRVASEFNDTTTNNHTRVEDDVELIDFLDIREMLIRDTNGFKGIEDIWFTFKAIELKNVPLTRTLAQGASSWNPTYVYSIPDDYEWWKRDEFKEIYKEFPKFYEHCSISVSTQQIFNATLNTVTVRPHDNIIDVLNGKQLYHFVVHFFDIGIKAKKASLGMRILQIVLVIVSIVLIIFGQAHISVKLLLIAATIGGALGLFSPKVQLILGVVLLAFGVYNTDWGSVLAQSGMELFKLAISNISMVIDLISQYQALGLMDDMKAMSEENANSIVDKQNKAIQYIYSDAYDEYDTMYNMLYNFEPKLPVPLIS